VSFKLWSIEYRFDLGTVPDLTSADDGRRRITIRPRLVILYSYDGGRTVEAGEVEGALVRKTDGGLGNSRRIGVGPRHDPPPAYVNDMMASLGLTWSGGAR
jgi:hypothetical protein